MDITELTVHELKEKLANKELTISEITNTILILLFCILWNTISPLNYIQRLKKHNNYYILILRK